VLRGQRLDDPPGKEGRMTTPLKVTLLGIVSILQLTATASSIYRYESTLRTGVLYRIPTAAVDPADAFRGRYVAVRPTIMMAEPIPRETQDVLDRIQLGEKGYVVLGADANGIARAAEIRLEPPTEGDYLQIASAWPEMRENPAQPTSPYVRVGYNLTFSFDRYYMNDAVAPQAQQRVTEAVRREGETRAWLAVKVKNGAGVIEGLFIDGVPIEQTK
jgi:uncharacterized membrane-anchored protein